RHLSVRRDQVALKLEPASSRHSHVKHQAGRTVRRGGLEKLGNRREFPDVEADRLQKLRNRVAKLGFVIDDADGRVRLTHPADPAPRKASFFQRGTTPILLTTSRPWTVPLVEPL